MPHPGMPPRRPQQPLQAVREDEEEDDGAPLDPQATAAALRDYGAFRERLLADQQRCAELLRAAVEEQRSYADLADSVARLQRAGRASLDALVPMGAGVHARAAVPDATRICVHVGLGFHPELTLEEAGRAAAARRQHLQAQVDARTRELTGVTAHLRLVEQALGGLAELQLQAQAQAGA